jgi:hypothetical protein
MPIVANTFLTYSAIGNREDLADTIYNISPVDTPFLGKIGTSKATAVKHEWQVDTLAAAGANAQLEGDDFTYGAVAASTRVDNMCQISYKTVVVSGTQDSVQKAGRKSEIVYQLMKRSKELRRDQEFILTGNQAKVVGAGATARQTRSLCSWYTTNAQRGATGASGGALTAATDGTVRPLTESLLKTALASAWTAGGDPDLILVGQFNKQVISAFAGNSTRMDDDSSDKTLTTAIDKLIGLAA